ncbi:MAG: hypothetical protein JXA09_07460 [Anaerolineae bacterium]|nr:hypothetical protein [Anaerolineae bacterium]
MQLFCDGHPQVAGFSEGLQPVLHRPQVLEEPVLASGSDVDAAGASIYGSVIRDGGVFRMWYQAWPRDWDGRDVVAVACAESDDGLTWRRPVYGLVECCGSRANHLTDLPFHSPSVIVDPDAPPERRYLAFGYADPTKMDRYAQRVTRRGYYVAHSADGVHWLLDGDEPQWPSADVITAAWNPAAGCALVAFKNNLRVRGMSRRSFFTAEWAGGQATPPVSALIPEEQDDLVAQARGLHSADYYGVGLMPLDGMTVGFLWNFRHQLPLGYSDAHLFHYGHTGRVDLSLVYQTERGGRWRHVPGRPDWLCAEDAPRWANGALYTASSPIEVGDETWFYFTGSLDRHGWCGKGVSYREWRQEMAQAGGWARIGLARWPRNRLMGYWARLREYVRLSPAPAACGAASALTLNAVVEPGGSVRARLIDAADRAPLPGYDWADAVPLTADALAAPLRWREREGLPTTAKGRQILAELELVGATVYAFDFQIAQ